MAVSRTYQVTERGGSDSGSLTLSVSAEGEDVIEMLLPPSTTDKEADVTFDESTIKGLHVSCTGVPDNTTITIKTNSTGAPADTITFKTPGGLFYATDANGASIGNNPFASGTKTKLYVSNPSTTNTGTFRFAIVRDPTP